MQADKAYMKMYHLKTVFKRSLAVSFFSLTICGITFAQQSTCNQLSSNIEREVSRLLNYVSGSEWDESKAISVCKGIRQSVLVFNQEFAEEQSGTSFSDPDLDRCNGISKENPGRTIGQVRSLNVIVAAAEMTCKQNATAAKAVADTSDDPDCISADFWEPGEGGVKCQDDQSTGEQIANTNAPSGSTSTANYCNIDTLEAEYDNKCSDMNEPAQFCCSTEPASCLFGDPNKQASSFLSSALATVLTAGTALKQAQTLKEACAKEKDQASVLNGLSLAMAAKCKSTINECTDACGLLAKKIKSQKTQCKAELTAAQDQNARTINAGQKSDANLALRLDRLTQANRQLDVLYNESNNKIETCEGFEKNAEKAIADAAVAEGIARVADSCANVADVSLASVPTIVTDPDWDAIGGLAPTPSIGTVAGGAADTPSYTTGGTAGLADVDLNSLLEDPIDEGADFGEASASGFGSVDAGSGGGGGGGGIPGGGSLAGGGAGGEGGYAPDDKVGSTLLGTSGGGGYSGSSGGAGFSNPGGGFGGYKGGSGKYAKKGSKFDLKKYLPGGKKDPNKAKRGLASKGEISLNVHSSIWDTISTTYKNELGSL